MRSTFPGKRSGLKEHVTANVAGMSTSLQRQARIAQIEKILAAGVSSATVDGESVTYDLDSLRTELRKLQAIENPSKRPTAFSLNFSRVQF